MTPELVRKLFQSLSVWLPESTAFVLVVIPPGGDDASIISNVPSSESVAKALQAVVEEYRHGRFVGSVRGVEDQK